jgi:hypothetical protein
VGQRRYLLGKKDRALHVLKTPFAVVVQLQRQTNERLHNVHAPGILISTKLVACMRVDVNLLNFLINIAKIGKGALIATVEGARLDVLPAQVFIVRNGCLFKSSVSRYAPFQIAVGR